VKNRLFVLIENSYDEAVFKQNLFDRRMWQMVTTGSEIKPVISSVSMGKQRGQAVNTVLHFHKQIIIRSFN